MEEKQITQTEYDFLIENCFGNGLFSDIIQDENEFTFLSFEAVYLEYYDSKGNSHSTQIVKESTEA